MKNGLSTLVKGTTGTPYRNDETTPAFHFGVFEMEASRHPVITATAGQTSWWARP